MTKIIVMVDSHEVVLLDTEHIKPSESSEYYKKLSYYNKLDEGLILLSSIDEKTNWKAAILLKNLKKKQLNSEVPEIDLLLQQCKKFSLSHRPDSHQLSNMKGLHCYRAGVDAGAGFKEGDLDVLGTEGFVDCTGVLVATEDERGIPCYYLDHISGDRTTEVAINEELDRILSDLQKLTNMELSWSELEGQVTLVGPGSNTEEPSLCYKQTFKILTRAKAKPTPLFGDSVAFNMTGTGDLIILEPKGQLNQGIQSKLPRIGHGVYSPIDNVSYSSDEIILMIENQISDAIAHDNYPYSDFSPAIKL